MSGTRTRPGVTVGPIPLHREDVRNVAASYAEQLARSMELLDEPDLTDSVRSACRKSIREAAAGVLMYAEGADTREAARRAFRRLAHDRISAEVERLVDELEDAPVTPATCISRAAVAHVVARRAKAAADQSIADAEAGRLRLPGGART